MTTPPDIPETCPRCGKDSVVRSFGNPGLIYCKGEYPCAYIAKWDDGTWRELMPDI